MTIVLICETFIFIHNGASRSFIIVDDMYPIPPKLMGRSAVHSPDDILFSCELGNTSFTFFSAEAIAAPNNDGGALTKKEERRKKAHDYVKEAMINSDIIIKEGIMLKGNKKTLKEHGIKLSYE
ncbi:MAG: hypothetical protein GWO79_00440 [Actinobacteria bacterium]|nr:hypothetical protein [Actinomycetota bacterium]